MPHSIISVDRASPAARAGIRAGDRLTHLNGTPVLDFLDYESLSADERVTVRVLREGEALEFRVRKDEYAPLGLNFASPMMSGTRMCCNHCMFCFVDQLPPHVRPTMRVKDDDWRTSLMMGSYVTLTNVAGRELERIIRLHASPLYISVHAIDPDLRSRLLGTPRGAWLPDQLTRLSEGGITFHTQAVLCPGLNDGEALNETIEWLSKLEGALSLALVPVGLTNFRDGLADLRKYTREEAGAVIDLAERWREKLLEERGTRFVFPSDEFYLAAGRPVPPDEAYEDYGQIDDGVGMLRLLETEYDDAWRELPEDARRASDGAKTRFISACGVSAAAFLRDLFARHPIRGAEIEVRAIQNTFFGSNVTVSGLITAGDLVGQLRGAECDCVLITGCMLQEHGDRFLDDVTLTEAVERLGKPIVPVGRRGGELLEAILRHIEP